MPTPPKESIGGFTKTILDAELRQLEINKLLLSNFMQDLEEYDEDFKSYVSERYVITEEALSKIQNLPLIEK